MTCFHQQRLPILKRRRLIISRLVEKFIVRDDSLIVDKEYNDGVYTDI